MFVLCIFALSLVATARAAISSICPVSDVCFQLNLPDLTASTGAGDIFFQISASAAYQWVALGQGSQMAGSNMFIIYSAANSENVTLSPRLGTGHVMPKYDTSAQVALLQGSGVSNGRMVANVRCSNCNNWSGGNVDFSGSSSDWIYAYKHGSALDSNDAGEPIAQHDSASAFTWDLGPAKGGNDTNPFISSVTSETQPSRPGDGTSTSPIGAGSDSVTHQGHPQAIIAHGILASLAFLVIFPTGAIMIRLANFKGIVWCHVGLQSLGSVLFGVAFATGVKMPRIQGQPRNPHPTIGIVVFVLLLVQPVFGYLHHLLYKKYQHRTAWSYIHIGVGRFALLLGLINGGLGLLLVGAPEGLTIAYGVLAGIVGFFYIEVVIFSEYRRNRKVQTKRSGERKHKPRRSGRDMVLQDRTRDQRWSRMQASRV